jgi:hypothetical protein
MVLQHMSSKDIARVLAISPHTVDQRIRRAMGALGAANRVEAARILVGIERNEECQPLICQTPDLARNAVRAPMATSAFEGLWETGDAGPVRKDASGTEAAARTASSPRLPSGEIGNRDSLHRIGWISVILASAALGFAALFIGFNALSEFTR